MAGLKVSCKESVKNVDGTIMKYKYIDLGVLVQYAYRLQQV